MLLRLQCTVFTSFINHLALLNNKYFVWAPPGLALDSNLDLEVDSVVLTIQKAI